ncbi:MAG: hypothetical protein C0501_05455 [Isosphaera sp.]|nr:hypothetical protein [Isosphaera sp.]
MSTPARRFVVAGSVAALAAAVVGLQGPAGAAAGDTPPPPALERYYPMPAPEAVAVAPAPVLKDSRFTHTALGAVVRANRGKVPASGEELVAALNTLGPVAQLPVPFSAVALNSGLANPRVVIAPCAVDPQVSRAGVAGVGLKVFGGFGLDGPLDQFGAFTQALAAARPGPLGRAAVTAPAGLDGRLFLAANLVQDVTGKPRVRAVEFISWNARGKRFDFGVIEMGGAEPEVQFLDGVRCFACHKNRGPILGQGPWSNSTHNDVARQAVLQNFSANPAMAAAVPPACGVPFPELAPTARRQLTFDGVSVVVPDPEACDAAVRRGSDLLRDREVFRAMAKYPDGRKALAVLFAAVASPGPIEQADTQSRNAVDLAFNVTGASFCRDVAAIDQAASGVLADFSPSGSMGALRSVTTNLPTGWGGGSSQRTDVVIVWGSDPKKVAEYDARRAAGDAGLPSHRRPSNPKAFVRPPAAPAPKPSAAVNAVSLARALGVTEGDRAFLAGSLADLAKRVGKRTTAAGLAREVFGTAAFTTGVRANGLPDREEFKELFASALAEVAAAHQADGHPIAREAYASGPLPGADEGRADAVVPTTACLRCHDVRGAGRPVFNPIPALAFDPFDRAGREAWLTRAGAKEKADVLGLLLRRLAVDKDMPPEDAAEYDRFRVREAAAFDAAREWLEAEAKKAGVK